ncbi:hypothetical protein MLD38_027204 [Melastoma candidum]|uniref:Uncharacterized protein n=1 Tax=Melastoma candidum TaxID=119954 RepID=A0ACB9P0Z6_9MYRT|nr:hypothetical protein MLD38_027204 [Melastoma candidum]
MFRSSQHDSGAFPSSQSTESRPPNPTKVWGEQGLMPVIVKQLSESYHSGDDKSVAIDGVEVATYVHTRYHLPLPLVTLLGRVCDKSARVTDVSFSLDDGTGRVNCRRWVNEAADSLEMEDIDDGVYVRVVGNLKSPHGRWQTLMKLVSTSLTVYISTCRSLNSRPVERLSPQKVELSKSLPSSNNTSYGNTISSAPANELSGNYMMDGLKSSDLKVLEFLQQNYAQEKGAHRDEISRHLKIPSDKIMDSIRTLEEEGLIYSTIDEYHYKSTTEG